jgi:ATP-dependent Lhr-like helicase
MAPRFAELGLRLDTATSDRDTRSSRVSSDLLIRTPEGLDGDLCYRSSLLKDVEVVVIDEIHTFLDSARGTQLVGLLSRLTEIAPGHQRIGISATIPDPASPEQAGFLRDPVLVREEGDAGRLAVEWHAWVGKSGQGAESFLRYWRGLGIRKAIGFVRTRARAEEVVHMLSIGFLRDKTLVHHGSTTTRVRRNTEEQIRTLQVGLAVATTTLEVGIDIGDLDTCILFDAPPDAASLLQRAGRAGRRNGLRRVVCVTGLYDRPTAFARVIEATKRGDVAAPRDVRPFLTGCVQQVLSLAAAGGSRSLATLQNFLVTTYRLDASVAGAIVAGLVREGFLREHQSYVALGDRAVALRDSRALHRTFAAGAGTPVVEQSSGRMLGQAAVNGQSRILLAGKGLQITGVDTRTGAALGEFVGDGQASFATPGSSTFEDLARRFAPSVGGAFRP